MVLELLLRSGCRTSLAATWANVIAESETGWQWGMCMSQRLVLILGVWFLPEKAFTERYQPQDPQKLCLLQAELIEVNEVTRVYGVETGENVENHEECQSWRDWPRRKDTRRELRRGPGEVKSVGKRWGWKRHFKSQTVGWEGHRERTGYSDKGFRGIKRSIVSKRWLSDAAQDAMVTLAGAPLPKRLGGSKMAGAWGKNVRRKEHLAECRQSEIKL